MEEPQQSSGDQAVQGADTEPAPVGTSEVRRDHSKVVIRHSTCDKSVICPTS